MILNLKSQSPLTGFYVVFNGAANLEKKGLYGISHLMEHLICKNFRKMRPEFEKYGIEWNAYTNQNEIVFFFLGLEKYLTDRKNPLLDLITDFKVTEKDFETEKKIILQEYNNTFSDQSNAHELNLKRKLFNVYDAIGLKEDIENLKFIDCINFFEKQFQNPSKIINVSNSHKFKAEIDFSDIKVTKNYEFDVNRNFVMEPMKSFKKKSSFLLVSPLIENNFAYINFINNMLSQGLSSPLYSVIREKKGLVYNISADQSRLNNQSFVKISTQTSIENLNQLTDSIKEIFDNNRKYLTPTRFSIIKNAYQVKYIKDKINRYSNVNLWINPKEWAVKNILDEIQYDDVMEIFDKYYDFDNWYLSIDSSEFS